MKTFSDWNPYYVLYAESNGFPPDKMLIKDDETWPGGKMCGFILWIDKKWKQFDQLFWKEYGGYRVTESCNHFGEWLKTNL